MVDTYHHRGVAYTMDGTGWGESAAFPRQVFRSEGEVRRAIDGLFRHADIGTRSEADRLTRTASTIADQARRDGAHREWR
jgi:hypothetical protein